VTVGAKFIFGVLGRVVDEDNIIFWEYGRKIYFPLLFSVFPSKKNIRPEPFQPK